MNWKDYADLIQRARADGSNISKKYIEFSREKFAKLSHIAPRVWQAAMVHRYILPPKLQNDYVSQEACDSMFLDFIMAYVTGMADKDDDVTHITYINNIRALEFDRPTYFIERSLAEALIRTDVPLDLNVNDIHWIYPQLRLYIPNDLLYIIRNGKTNPAMFIDICKVEENTTYSISNAMRKELYDLGGWNFPRHEVSKESILINTCLNFDCDESNIAYAVTAPWEGTTMRKMIDIGNSFHLQGGMENDQLDHEFMSRVLCFAMNVMLRLSSLPAETQQILKQSKTIRKPKQEGKRTIVGLYAAKIIGMDDESHPAQHHEPIDPTGRHLVAHWRKGHWRRQAYGPKMGLRRFQWIQPYHVGQ
jgi:hypothetical protein